MSAFRICLVALLFTASVSSKFLCKGSVYEDPHIKGFRGRTVEFDGIANTKYHVYSDPFILVSALFVNASNMHKASATVMSEIYVQFDEGKLDVSTASTTVTIGAGSPSPFTPTTGSPQTITYTSCVSFHYDGAHTFTLTTPSHQVIINWFPADGGNWYGVPYLNLNITHAYEDNANLGGFLGFTASTVDHIKFTQSMQAGYSVSSFSDCTGTCMYTAQPSDCNNHVARSTATRRSASFESRSVTGGPASQQQADWNVNSDFENPSTAVLTYNPTGTQYSYSGGAGVAKSNGGAFNAVGATGQFAFAQSASSVSRQYYIQSYKYIEITWTDAGRSGSTNFDGNASYNLTVTSDAGGVVLSSTRTVVDGQAFGQQSEVFFVLCEGSYTVKFMNLETAGDHTFYIDNLMLMNSRRGMVNTIGNSGFETPPQNGGYNYANIPYGTNGGDLGYFAAAPWLLLKDGASLSGGQGFAYAGTDSHPGQWAVLQTGATVWQTLTLNSTGTYKISYSVAARYAAAPCNYAVTVVDQLGAVYLNSQKIAVLTTFTSVDLTVTVSANFWPSIYTFKFTNTETTGDVSVYFDDITVTNN